MVGAGLKMYLDHSTVTGWARALRATVNEHPALVSERAELFVLPSHLSVDAVGSELAGSRIKHGGQDLSDHARGPYTGEVSGDDLAALGCTYVEIGHAERRARHGENDETIASKVERALLAGLTPIVCVGEHEHMSADDAAAFCREQVSRSLAFVGVASAKRIIVAYEPIWAIGAADPAQPDYISAVCAAVGSELTHHLPDADSYVLYGGSARPGMLADLDTAVEGLFIGRSSHRVANVAAVLDEVMDRAA